MIIYKSDGTQLLDIPVDDNSYRYRAIKQGAKVILYFSATGHIDIPLFSYIDYQGERYILSDPTNFKKNGTRKFEYTVEFDGYWIYLLTTKYKYLSMKPYKLKFPLTAKPRIMLQLLVDNLNLYDTGWTVGTCIEASEKYITFSYNTCMEALQKMCDEWNTEFEFVNKTINFGKVEKFKDAPLALAYGKGNGFKVGVGRQNKTDKKPVTVLYVQGGERNIDYSLYGSSTLLLPKAQQYTYQGRTYKTDDDGIYITRADRTLTVHNEDGYNASQIYPSRVGKVSEVITVDASTNLYDFKDSSIPESLNFSDMRIEGEKATIIFQSGLLTGREFDIEQTDDALTGYVHSERRFKLVPLQADGMTYPNETFKPAIGDEYAIFNIKLPQAYICDNDSQSGASWDMFREACQYMYENEDNTFSFTGDLDGVWSKSRWLEIGGKITPGGYISFSDTQFQPDGVLVRITSVKEYINKPHSPQIELSNAPVAGFVSSELGKIADNEVKVDDINRKTVQYTKRRFHDAKELLSMLNVAVAGFSGAINPITIQTMAMLVGDESLQFRFVDSKTNPSEVTPAFTYDNTTKVFTAPANILQHMTMGITKLSSAHAASEYKYWDVAAYTSPALDFEDPCYLYCKCSKTTASATFMLSKTAYKLDPGDGYYYLLTGALSSEYDGARSFVTLYGFTEILPGRITVGLIISTDGNTYINLLNGEIHGKITFTSGSSGYNNISDKPDLSVYSTLTMLNAAKSDLQNQVDGKIESYFQTTNPWNNWASGTESTHVGDLWYNTSTKTLQRYVGPTTNNWQTIEDATAIAAAAAAAAAQDTADGKRRTFLSTPYTPYDSGDLWVQDGLIKKCTLGRTSGSYVATDWAEAADSTKTVIDNGVITTGNVKLASDDGTVNSGVTGSGGTDAVRFWAGTDFNNRASAPYRVLHNGKVYATDGVFSGSFECADQAEIKCYESGTRFFKVTKVGTTLLQARCDNGRAAEFSVYGTNNDAVALSLLCNVGGYGKALESYGNNELNARVGETSLVKGMRMNVRTLGSGNSGTINVYTNDDLVQNTSGNAITLLLPAPYNVIGKRYLIRNSSGSMTIRSQGGTFLYGTNSTSSIDIGSGDTKLREIIADDNSRWIYNVVGD